jgi:hypothetical protein
VDLAVPEQYLSSQPRSRLPRCRLWQSSRHW